jgi:uncharacterized protein (DUF433 family)
VTGDKRGLLPLALTGPHALFALTALAKLSITSEMVEPSLSHGDEQPVRHLDGHWSSADNSVSGAEAQPFTSTGLLRLRTFAMDYSNIITIEPGKMGGKPCIRGLRITAYDVLDYLASGMTEGEILGDFPDLTEEDIRACLAFAADRERKLAGIPR